MHSKILILFIAFILLKNQSISQTSCNCNEYTEYAKNTNDSAIAFKLIALNKPVCNAKGFEIVGLIMSKANKFDSSEYYFKKAEILYQQYNVTIVC